MNHHSSNQTTLSKTTVSMPERMDALRHKPLLNIKDVQAILGVGRTSTYAFIKNNPPFRVVRINNSIRIPSRDLFLWRENGDSR